MSFETIRLDRHGSVAVLALSRPERRNAINQAMVGELGAALDRIAGDDEVRALVVHGEGRSFCAGFDLKESAATRREGVKDWRPVLKRDFDVIMRFWHFPKPTIAAVHGHCIAAGFELALACDITVAAAGTRFGEPELRFGSGIVALLLPWLTNPKRAKELLLTGNDRIDAREALDFGLINRVVAEDTHLQAALAIARDIAVMDAQAVQLTKEAVNRTYALMGMQAALDMGLDVDVQIESLDTPERRTFREISQREGLRAALAWRESRFGGGGEKREPPDEGA